MVTAMDEHPKPHNAAGQHTGRIEYDATGDVVEGLTREVPTETVYAEQKRMDMCTAIA